MPYLPDLRIREQRIISPVDSVDFVMRGKGSGLSFYPV
jgi:hypothetical protein